MATAATQQSVARYIRNAGGLPDELMLGWLTIFTIRDAAYSLAALTQAFKELDLDERFLPKPDLPVNAFKKAVTDNQDFVYSLSNGRTATLLIRDVAQDNVGITKHVVREVKDKQNRRLGFETVGQAVFYRPVTSQGVNVVSSARARFSLDGDRLTAAEVTAVKPFIQGLNDSYQRYLDNLDDMKVRAMVRDYLRHLHSVTLKPGVWFTYHDVHAEHARLATLVHERLGNGCSMSLIPLADLESERDLIVSSAQEEAQKELQVVTEGLIETLKKPAVSPKVYETQLRRYEEVRARAQEHTKRLSLTVDTTEAADKVAQRYLDQLLQKSRKGRA